MRKHAWNITLLLTSIALFIWTVWQHETLFKYVMTEQLWNSDFAFFWGIHLRWGLAYDFTLFFIFLAYILPYIALWFWEDDKKET